jgi:hypothetical protein
MFTHRPSVAGPPSGDENIVDTTSLSVIGVTEGGSTGKSCVVVDDVG